jgi:hypothetical protein
MSREHLSATNEPWLVDDGWLTSSVSEELETVRSDSDQREF